MSIRIQPNGPYIVTGPITVEDPDGHVLEVITRPYGSSQ